MEVNFQFVNRAQREFYYSTVRNQCFSGGFNNGKSFGGCFKAFTLLSTFPNYRMAIARQTFADLKKTTMETFFKICPREFIETNNTQDGLTILKNRSRIHWLHLDKVDESTLRGLEINSALVDQAEETEEKVIDVLDGRIGRWDKAEIPKELIDSQPDWPRNPKTNLPLAPSYLMLLCNPDTQFHHIYRKYHPDSLERHHNYFYVEGEWDSGLGSVESYDEALKRDDEWVAKYVRGQWGVSNVQIHRLDNKSLLNFDANLLEKIRKKGNLFRILDHGEAAPTCCLWWAVLEGIFICYREYYVPGQPISYHRRAISDLSGDEVYSANYADPQIFKKTAQKDGGWWTTASEYLDPGLPAPPLTWIPADNNEFATRNRINELITPKNHFKHPVSGEISAPGIYFIKKSPEYPNGCYHAITELQSQRRKSLGYIDGKQIFCDDREESIADHAYDCIRYFVAAHSIGRAAPKRKAPQMSIKYFQMLKKRMEGKLVAGSV